ncbi:hypothetical protein KC722_00295 [Candidatus Kaiserbacteria bacterium]|nr:hypothetical protein [Candidatus Kaiserbacteria bacterium]MCB9811964.1 hypothetical protein [Candidatus Nomurabacteria bacterium]
MSDNESPTDRDKLRNFTRSLKRAIDSAAERLKTGGVEENIGVLGELTVDLMSQIGEFKDKLRQEEGDPELVDLFSRAIKEDHSNA